MTAYVAATALLKGDDEWTARTQTDAHAHVSNGRGFTIVGTADDLLDLAAALEAAAGLLADEAARPPVAAVVNGHGPASWRNAEGDVQ